jgi:hypothetical protein
MNNGDKPLPYSEDAEKGVLCSLILEPRLAGEIRSQVRTDYFYNPANKYLYQAVLKLLDCGKAVKTSQIDFELLASHLSGTKHPSSGTWLDEIGQRAGLLEIFNHVPTAANWAYYADEAKEKWARREKILDCRRQEQAALNLQAPPSEWDPDGSYLGAVIPRKLKGASFLNFSERKIDESKTLLGDRYLCQGGGLFIVAPSGHGKSVLTAQAAIELACGLPAFGIRPSRPLKSMIIQAEDDDGDIIEMAQIVNHLELGPDQRKQVGNNTHVEFVNDVTGDEFLKLCDGFLSQRRADLLWINPYTAYLGADIKDDGANTHFLRNGLNPILTAHDCGAVVLHHTPKTNFRDTTSWKPSDWMYSGAGAAVLTNWARAYLAIDPCEDQGVYKFIAAKRGNRIGWGDCFPVFEQIWAHNTEGKLLWVPANQHQIAAVKAKGQNGPEDLLPLIPFIDPIIQERLFLLAKEKRSLGVNKVRGFLKILIEDGKIKNEKIKRQGTRSGIGYVRAAGECL